MSYLPDPKDPAEIITVSFDFSAITNQPSNPAVTVSVRWGTEQSPTLVAVGQPTVQSHHVSQRFSGGAHLTDYNIKCLADTHQGDRRALDCILAVRTRPI